MCARVSELQVLPGKLKEFVRAAESTIPLARKQEGFRAFLLLRTSKKDPAQVMVVSVWDSHAELKASEKNLFLYQALSRVMSYCKGFPNINECEVLLTEFAAD